MLIGLFYDKLSVMWKDEQLMFTLKELQSSIRFTVLYRQVCKLLMGKLLHFCVVFLVYLMIHREEGWSAHGPLAGSSVFPCISVQCVEWTEDLVVVELKAP